MASVSHANGDSAPSPFAVALDKRAAQRVQRRAQLRRAAHLNLRAEAGKVARVPGQLARRAAKAQQAAAVRLPLQLRPKLWLRLDISDATRRQLRHDLRVALVVIGQP